MTIALPMMLVRNLVQIALRWMAVGFIIGSVILYFDSHDIADKELLCAAMMGAGIASGIISILYDIILDWVAPFDMDDDA